MKIGVDIDGVLTIFENYKWAYQEYYDLFEIDGDGLINPFDYAYNLYNWNQEQKEKFWNEYQKYLVEDISMQPLANNIIKKLKDDGHEIYIITSRKPYECNGNMTKLTEGWLKKNNIIYDELLMNAHNKLEVCKDIGIQVHVEDNPDIIMSVSTEIPVLCFHNSYNTNCESNNIVRVFSWPQVYREILKLDKGCK